MPFDRDQDEPRGVLGALLMPLRLPGRVVSDIETVTAAVLSLVRNTEQRLGSVDERTGQLVESLSALRGALERIDARVEKLQALEGTVDAHMKGLRGDLNERLLAVEEEVRAMRAPVEQMARDTSQIVRLLPDPSAGPMARLKDTLTSSE
ncbi:MAG: hypothetical protein ACR2IP_05365 [Solirubrobacteraceae bacterium]